MSKVMLICGVPGTGKTTLAQRAASDAGGLHVEASTLAVQAFNAAGARDTFVDFVKTMFRDSGRAIDVAELCVHAVRAGLGTHSCVVVSGLRTPEEVHHVKTRLPQAIIVFLRCPTEVRRRRKQATDPTTRLCFDDRELLEASFGTRYVELLADVVLDTRLSVELCLGVVLSICGTSRGVSISSRGKRRGG